MTVKLRTIEIDAEIAERLEARAAARGVSVSELIAELSGARPALPPDLEAIRREGKGPWSPAALAEDKRRWAEFQRTGEAVPWEELRAWMESWGTPNQPPPSQAPQAVKVAISPDAARDLMRLHGFLAEPNPEAAAKAIVTLDRAIQSLASFPERGRPSEVPGLRELVVPFGRSSYLLRYAFDQETETILVVRIWHGREARE